MENKIWKVIKLSQYDSYFNVAIDEALLDLMNHNTRPTLVTTEWFPTISVGYSQDVNKDVDLEACKKYNTTLVRRISGGQAVYLDEGYIVFSLVAQKECFPKDLSKLRESVCNVIVETLKENKIPCKFYPPDNIVTEENGNIRTIGNSGQRIRKNTIALHGSIRYDLLNFEKMLDMLMINGNKLNPFTNDIKKHLGYVKMYNQEITKEELQEKLIQNLIENFGNGYVKGKFSSQKEFFDINSLANRKYSTKEWLFNSVSNPETRGVCYFYLNGECIIPEIAHLLPYNKPSGLQEATIEVNNGVRI